jgi:hypothetical protein
MTKRRTTFFDRHLLDSLSSPEIPNRPAAS